MGDEPPTGSETKGVGLACMQGLGLPGLDKTEKKEGPMALMGSRCLLEQGTLEQTHRQALREVYKKTGLYAGTGAPWAGQTRASGVVASRSMWKVVEASAGNLGTDPPTGSNGKS